MLSQDGEVTRASKLRKVSSAELIEELNERNEDFKEKEQRLRVLEEKLLTISKEPGDVLEINAGGQVFAVRRSTLCLATGSAIAALFSGQWDKGQHRDTKGRPFLDIDPYIFEKIVNFLRQKSIEGPDRPAPKPIITPEKAKEFEAVIEYYGLKECLYGTLYGPLDPLKVQSFSIPGQPSSLADNQSLHAVRGYALHLSMPLHLRAVLVAVQSTVRVAVGQGIDRVLREVETEAIRSNQMELEWKGPESHLSQVAKFNVTLQPGDAFIMVRFPSDILFHYLQGDNQFRGAGDFRIQSKYGIPLSPNALSLCMRIVYA